MSIAAEHLKAQILNLPSSDRASLAQTLLQSLEEEDRDAEAAWDAELQRRLVEVESGQAQGRLAADVLAEIKASLR